MRRLLDSPALRFLVCGGAAAAVNWLARIVLSLALPFWASVVIAYGIGMLVGFALYRGLVFDSRDLPVARQALRFVSVNAISAVVVLAASLGLNAIVTRSMGSNLSLDVALIESVAHGLAIGIGAVANYLGHSRFTFAAAGIGAIAAER